MNWPEYPALRMCMSFIIGVALGGYLHINSTWLLLSLLILLIVLKVTDRRNGLEDSTTLILSSFIVIIGLLAGITRTQLSVFQMDKYHYSHYIQEQNTLIGTVLEDVKKKTSTKTTIDVKRLNGQNTRGKLLIYFPRKDTVNQFKPGDVIALKGKIYDTRENSNPLAFDYKAYLRNRGVGFQAYLRSGEYALVEKRNMSYIKQLTYDLRSRALIILEERLRTKEQLATASAMILGYRDHISEDLYKAYAATGSVHVLAVSGLHVGIICWIFIALFSRIKNESLPVKIFKAVFLILLVWFYAILTGAAPAVIRASVMFTIMIIGKYWFDYQNIYNTLAFSALLLLMYDPLLLFQASFQFSYLALVGIVFFHKVLYPLYESRYIFVDKVWNLGVVALAAQTLVFPVTVYYFHKFPLYFIVSGIVSVTLAFVILTLGILVILLSSIPILGDVLAYCLRAILDLFINIIYMIRDWPYSNLSDLWISKSTTIFIYIGLFSIMYFIHNKKKIKEFAFISTAVILGLIYNNTIYKKRTSHQNHFIVYEVSKGSILDIFNGTTAYSFVSEGLSESSELFAADNYRVSSNIKNTEPLLTAYKREHKVKNGIIQYLDKIVYIPSMADDITELPTKCDILLLMNNINLWPNQIMQNVKAELIVIDKSIHWKLRKEWNKYAIEYAIPIHDISTNGAFEL